MEYVENLLRYDPAALLIIGVAQVWSSSLIHLNRTLYEVNACRQDTPGTDIVSPDEETLFALSKEPRHWRRVEYTRSPELHGDDRYRESKGIKANRGYVIGTHGEADFRIPRETGGSSIHCRVYFSRHGTWMVHDESRNWTTVNGDRIDSRRTDELEGTELGGPLKQVALDPDIVNTIEIGRLTIKLLVVGKPRYIGLGESLVFLDDPTCSISAFAPSTATAQVQIAPNRQHYFPYIIRGEGTAIRKTTGEQFAAMIFDGDRKIMTARRLYHALKELLMHDHMLSFYDGVDLNPSLNLNGGYMILQAQYEDAHSLNDLELAEDGLGSSSLPTIITCQIMSALQHLHANNIVFRAMCPENILWRSRQRKALLTSFLECRDGPKVSGLVVEEPYRAPEIKGRARYTAKADVFALCVIFKHLLDTWKLHVDPEISRILSYGLAEGPDKRPSAGEILGQLKDLLPSDFGSPFRSITGHIPYRLRCRITPKGEHLVHSSDLQIIASFCFGLDQDEFNNHVSKDNIYAPYYANFSQARGLFTNDACPQDLFESPDSELEFRLRKRETTNFDVEYLHPIQIVVHVPSQMVNVTSAFHVQTATVSPNCVQQVCGEDGIAGTYISSADFIRLGKAASPSFSSKIEKTLSRLCPGFQDSPKAAFKRFITTDYINEVLVWSGLHLFRAKRNDGSANPHQIMGANRAWEGPKSEEYISNLKSIKLCEMNGFSHAAETLKRLHEEPPDLLFPQYAIGTEKSPIVLDGDIIELDQRLEIAMTGG